MKKFLAVLALALLVTAQAAAADIDLSSMSNEDLGTLNAQIEQEMINRGLIQQHLYIGEYIVGQDLEPGTYVLSVVQAYQKYSSVYIQYDIYEYDATQDEWVSVTFADLDAAGQKCTFKLKEGQKLIVSNGEFEIFSYKKK